MRQSKRPSWRAARIGRSTGTLTILLCLPLALGAGPSIAQTLPGPSSIRSNPTLIGGVTPAPPIVSLDMSADLKTVSVQIYNQWAYRLCLADFGGWSQLGHVTITLPNGSRVRSQGEGMLFSPARNWTDTAPEPCQNPLYAGETVSRSWGISGFYPKLPKAFSICHEIEWEGPSRGDPQMTSTACSTVRKLANGEWKVTPRPTKVPRSGA